jgi:hypothetical protein
MATRSVIAVKNENESFDAIYCHFDGYPEGVGQTLKDNYNSEELARSLIAKGSLSTLEKDLESSSFYTSRGEKLQKYNEESFKDLKKLCGDLWGEYLYVFQDGKWHTFEA